MNLMQGRHKDLIISSVFVALTLLLSCPLQIYFNDIYEFRTSILAVLLHLAVFTAVAFGIFYFTSKRISLFINGRVLSFLIFSIGFLFWLQIFPLSVSYGLMDGDLIDWINYRDAAYNSSIVWVSGLLLFSLIAFFLRKKAVLGNVAFWGSSILIFTQLFALCVTFYDTEIPWFHGMQSDRSKKFSFSKDSNIILLIVDAFPSETFNKTIQEKRQLQDIFNGFTFFRNNVGGFTRTNPSIPLILSGLFYDNSESLQNFIKKAMLANSIPKVLNNEGYDVYMPANSVTYIDESISKNLKSFNDIFYWKDTSRILLLTGFRILPDAFKQYYYEYLNSAFTDDIGDSQNNLHFLNEFNTKANADNQLRTFKYYHISGAHPPFRLLEDLIEVNLPENREGLFVHARGVLAVIKNFLEKLKTMGVYDNSMIIIMADHGLASPNVQTMSEVSEGSDGMGYLSPLLLVKPFNKSGNLQISDAPVHSSYISQTVFDALEIPVQTGGISIFRVPDDDIEPRRLYSISWKSPMKDYMPEMYEYLIKGHVFNPDSWYKTKQYMAPKLGQKTMEPYLSGQSLLFGFEGNAEIYEEAGWSTSYLGTDSLQHFHSNVSFPFRDKASFFIPIAQTGFKNVMMSFDMKSVTSKGQRVRVFINGVYSGLLNVTKLDSYQLQARVPQESLEEKALRIRLEFPDAKEVSASLHMRRMWSIHLLQARFDFF